MGHHGPNLLLVVAPDAAVARWCAQPIELGHPGFVLQPLVAGPDAIPVLIDEEAAGRDPELAVLSAMAHGREEVGPAIIQAVLSTARGLDDERFRLYLDLAVSSLGEAVRRALEALMQRGNHEVQSAMTKSATRIETRELTPELWPAFEKLFGANGACAGCWCMFWRLEEGERFDDVKGAEAKRRMKALVRNGEAQGLLAFVGGEPVGWLALGPRREFKKLDRAPSLKCDDADDVWSLPCFFVHKDWRGQGVATALLKAALPVLKARGAKVVEGYPVKPPEGTAKLASSFAYTGTVPLFLKQGFEVVAERPKGKQRVRKQLRASRA